MSSPPIWFIHPETPTLDEKKARITSLLQQGILSSSSDEDFDGIDLSARIDGKLHPLHITAIVGSDEDTDLLIRKGAHVNCLDPSGHTPLHYSCSIPGAPSVARMLLDHGACPRAATIDFLSRVGTFPVYLTGGQTPLHFAAKLGPSEEASTLVPLLLERDPGLKDVENNDGLRAWDLWTARDEISEMLKPSLDNETRRSVTSDESSRRCAARLAQQTKTEAPPAEGSIMRFGMHLSAFQSNDPIPDLVPFFSSFIQSTDMRTCQEAVYYFYGCQNEDDRGWGCTFRATQTVLSCAVKVDGFRSREMPSVAELKQLSDLAKKEILSENPENFEEQNSEEYEKAKMVRYCEKLGLAAKCTNFALREERFEMENCLWEHFGDKNPLPVIIDDDTYAYSIVGVCQSDKSPHRLYLKFDPHVFDRLTEEDVREGRGGKAVQWLTFANAFKTDSERWSFVLPKVVEKK